MAPDKETKILHLTSSVSQHFHLPGMATDYKNNSLWQLNSNISVSHLLVLQLLSLPTSCFGIFPSSDNNSSKFVFISSFLLLWHIKMSFTSLSLTNETRFYLSISFSYGIAIVKNLSPLSIGSYKRSLLAYTAITTDENFLPLSMASDKKKLSSSSLSVYNAMTTDKPLTSFYFL